MRNIEVRGEAVSQLAVNIKEKYPAVPWQEIKGFRNVVIHKYHSVDIDILWDIIQNKLDPLRKQIEDILRKERIK